MPKLQWGPPAFVIALIALFVALGGTGYALTQTNASQVADRSATARTLPAWHSLTLTGGWIYGGGGTYHAAYYKDSGNVVHLRGSAYNGSTSQAAFRLPSGARPAHLMYLPIYANGGSLGALEIMPDGHALIFDDNSGNNVTGYAGLDGVSFRVP